jgi:maltooligosyltrehalose trehalohydrolase
MPDPLPQLIHASASGAFLPFGASVGDNGVTYRVWAPDHPRVEVRIETPGGIRSLELDADGDGIFTGLDVAGRAGDLYRFQMDGKALPDPASRYQPHGVDGPSQVIDPFGYAWLTKGWRRPSFGGRVIYELHVGTFTHEGTFTAAISRLDALVELGVNTIELMPLADFAGDRNWGYDGVMLFAPARCYGTPDELRALVDAAHVRGLGVIIDVVYNHIGPCGNVLPEYARRYFHTERASIWGQGLNYDEPHVRRFFIQNACQWLDEYRFDGLRIDAVHAIIDDAPRHLVAEITAAAHARNAWVIAEDERNDVNVITPERQGGWGLDGMWSDDLHHTLRVALTGQKEAHFKSYTGSIDEWVKTLTQGWLYDGQFFPHWNRARGTPAGHVPPERFVVCISNHDQVGNRPLGDRLHDVVTPEVYRAVSVVLCLSPYTPMLFMGQEWASESPFPFFTDLPGEVGANMAANRLKEFAHYGAHYSKDVLERMPDPQRPGTFVSSKLNWNESDRGYHRQVLKLYRDCLQLRARKQIFQSPPRDRWTVRQVGAHVMGVRWDDPKGDWLLLAGVSPKAEALALDDPFIRHVHGRRWRIVLASNEPCFGGAANQLLWSGDERSMVVGLPGAVLLREVRDEVPAPASVRSKKSVKDEPDSPAVEGPLPCPV